MKFLTGLCVRARWLNSAAGILVVLLQRTPVVRTLLTAESALSTPAACLLRSMLPVAAALGAVHSMAGASTQLVANVNQPAKATAGTPFSETVIIQGLGVSFAQSWTISASTPPGINPQGATLQSGRWVINPSGGTLTLAGTPTTAGTYSFSVSGYQYTNLTGPVTNATATIAVSPAPNSAPKITASPNSFTVLTGGTATFTVGYSGTPAPTFQWFKDSVAISGATGATLTLSNISFADAGSVGYTVTVTNSLGSATSSAGVLTVAQAPVAPTIITPPVAQTANVGDPVQFTVAVSGTPTPTLQWLKDGSGIDGATGTTLTIANVQLSDAGGYSVTVANSQGTATSATAQLTVNVPNFVPSFSSPPLSQTVATGSTVVFTAPAVGSPTPIYSWLFNGTTIPGATSATLMIPRATVANAGAYTAVAQNSLGLATSTPAALTVITTNDPGRLINLSVLTDISAAVQNFTVGTVIGPSGVSGTKALVVRADGPSLGALGVPGTIGDPQLTLFNSSSVSIAANDNWGTPVGAGAASAATLTTAMANVGAFPFTGPTSLDAVVYQPSLAPGGYTVAVSGVNGSVGTALAEIYDATPAGTYTPASPRLINVSVLKQIASGGSLTLGFTIGGSTARTVLIRVIGPGLSAVGLNSGTLSDPQLTLYDSSSQVIATNDDWGADPQLVAAMSRVGAFSVGSAPTKDSMLLVTLPVPPPQGAGYTARATGNGSTSGYAIVEVYEVP